jgi:AraC family transcriptional regulator of adaptative response / DNA-3-methyladenine glycosylase II
VGLGTRQLRRLFIEHVGVAPIKLVTSHRIQLAKHLISESNSPLTEIALSSGFKSIREFNHAILKSTGASPRKLRRAIGSSLSVTSLNKLRLCLAYKRPFDWAGVIEFLQMRAVPGVELVQQDCYQRTIEVRGVAGLLTVRPNQALARLDVELESSSYKGVLEIAGRVRRIFDLNADPVQISNHLRRDPTLQSSVNCRPGLRVPGAWDGFEAAVLAAAGESLASPGDGESIRPLVSIFGARIENKVPGLNYLFPRPEVLAVADLSKAGLSNECAERVRRLALFALDNQFGSAYFPTLEERISRMRAHTGIDQITAHYIAMRAFGEPDAFPADGWKIGRRIKAATGDSPSLIQAMAIADHWRPWRAYAAMHLTYTKSTVRIS